MQLCSVRVRRCRPVMDLWSRGLAVDYRRAHRRRYNLWAPVRLPQARRRLARAAPWTLFAKLEAGSAVAEGDLLYRQRLCRPSFRKAAERGRPVTGTRAKL